MCPLQVSGIRQFFMHEILFLHILGEINMSATESKTCTCLTCGYEWERGRDGFHICSVELLKTIESLKAVKTLAFGDQVLFAERPIELQRLIPTGEYLVITDTSICQGSIEYAVNGSAWYSRDDLELVARADEKSLAFAFKALDDENEDEEL
jgi:hypothetical protein